jgi:hypothetical protein
MRPLAWYLCGCRIVGRTAVEMTRDGPAQFLANSVASTLAMEGGSISDVIDPFVGSGNLLYHVLRATRARRGIGFDTNADVLPTTKRNFALLSRLGKLNGVEIVLEQKDWSETIDYVEHGSTLVLLSPPWGDAFGDAGLDLRRTTPPVPDILHSLRSVRGAGQIFVAIQTYPRMVEASVKEIREKYSMLSVATSDDPRISRRIDYLLLRI